MQASSEKPPSSCDFFIYGTLLVPEIWNAVTGLSFAAAAPRVAVLEGYVRRRVHGATFPGILATGQSDDVVDGLLITGLTPPILDRLDRYEDDFYLRREVRVTVSGAGNNPATCQTYIVPASEKHVLSDDPWDYEWFQKNALDDYLSFLSKD